MAKPKNIGITWRFFRAGGFDQVRLDSARELLALDQLDQKLWVALACPVDNVFFDKRTLTLIDTDGDGRIRPGELMSALTWAGKMLKDPEVLVKGGDGISVEAVSDTVDEAKTLTATVRRALVALGREESGSIAVTDTQSLKKVLSEKAFNGDGIITEEASEVESVKNLIRDIISTEGSVTDRSGKPGIDAAKIDGFFNKAAAYVAWMQEGERPDVRPLGEKTADAAGALAAVREKIDDYFTRCAIAHFDDRSTALLTGGENEYAAIGALQLSAQSGELAKLPLARIGAQRPVQLTDGVNPAWTSRMERFSTVVVAPVLGARATLTAAEWNRIASSFAPFFAWQAKNPASGLDAVGAAKVKEHLAGDKKDELAALIAKDTAEAATYDSLVDLERLVRYRRDLSRLCNNFVNFKDFYSQGGGAIFQAGTLYLDQRSCNLCVKVDDANKHGAMAALAGTCLVYCECRRKAGAEKLTIVAAVTNGDSENLMVGRNGVFYDRDGTDWDATVIKIIENPISLKQAFWLPYNGLVRMIENQVAKRAAAADAQANQKLAMTAETVANVDKNAPAKPAQPSKIDVGTVAALGVAVGAIGTFVATFFGYAAGIIKLGPLAMIAAMMAAIVGLLLLISGPSLILAYIKLRKRNLGPILDAGGWAVNAKARINVPFGEMLTGIATLPRGSRRDMADPYAEKKSPWPRLIVMAILLYIAGLALDHFGYIHEWTKGKIGKARNASAAIENGKKGVEPAPAIK